MYQVFGEISRKKVLKFIFRKLILFSARAGSPRHRPRGGPRREIRFQEARVIVCHCRRVSDRAIRAAVRGGARSCQEVDRACEAGRGCGGCQPLIRRLIKRESKARHAPALLSSLLAMLGFLAAG
jgi:NAD(P)H-nitrite reductase large subunit